MPNKNVSYPISNKNVSLLISNKIGDKQNVYRAWTNKMFRLGDKQNVYRALTNLIIYNVSLSSIFCIKIYDTKLSYIFIPNI